MEHALNNLRQRLFDAANRLGLPVFWRWWTSTLAPMMPAKSRTAVQRRRLRPVIAFGDGVAVLWELRVVDASLTLAEIARVPLTGDPAAVAHAGRTALAALPSQPGGLGSGVKVFIALPPAQVLRKRLTLPAAIDEHLKEALAFDLDRHTPFRPDQLYFDAVVVARDAAKKEITVDWAAALRSVVDTARRHAESFGASVVGVTPEPLETATGAPPAPAAWSKLNLLPPDERPDTRAWRRPRVWIPAALVIVMTLVAIVLPIWQKRDYVIALNETTERARVEAAASDALRQQLDRATGDYNFALGRKYAYPSTVQLLDDVTRILPDDTWLTQMEVKSVPKGKEPHREILLRGESANAGRLISALEDSKLFELAAPRSPTTKIQPGPGEVFDLGAQLKALAPPEPIKLVAALPAAKPAPVPAATPPATAPTSPTVAPTSPTVAPTSPTAAPTAPAAPTDAAAGAPAPAAPGPAAAPARPGAPSPTMGVPAAEHPPGAPQAPMGATQVLRQGGGPGAARPPTSSPGGPGAPPRGPLSAPSAQGWQSGLPGQPVASPSRQPTAPAPAAEGQGVPATAPGSGAAMSPGNAPAAEAAETDSGGAPTAAPLATSGAAAAKGVIAPLKGGAK